MTPSARPIPRELSPFTAAFPAATAAGVGGLVLVAALGARHYLWTALGAAALLLGMRGTLRSLARAHREQPSLLPEALGAVVLGALVSWALALAFLALDFLSGPYPFG